MNQFYLTIGQMAQLNHISAQTLRLYDKEGLIHPVFYDETNGYRYYHIHQCARLDMIHTMKICGMTLKQIKRQLNDSSPEELYTMLLEQDRQLEKKMRQLMESRKSIKRLCTNIRQLSSLPPVGEIFFENMPERYIDAMHTEFDYFTDGYAGYEKMLRKLKDRMVSQELPLSYFYNAGTLIEKEDFEKERYVSRTVFIFVDKEYPQVETVQTIPAGMVMAICAENPDKELEYAKKLYRHIKDTGYQIAGDYMCEVISRLPTGENPVKNEMIYKIQVPVRR